MDGVDNNERPYSSCTCYGCAACFKREDALLYPNGRFEEQQKQEKKEEECSDDEEDIQVHLAPLPPCRIKIVPIARKTCEKEFKLPPVVYARRYASGRTQQAGKRKHWSPCYRCSEKYSRLAVFRDITKDLLDDTQCPNCN